eukprot:SAG25_NODE_6370_length_566_cov_1.047109_1_plen_129_part_01
MQHYVVVPNPNFTVGVPCSYDAFFSHSERAALLRHELSYGLPFSTIVLSRAPCTRITQRLAPKPSRASAKPVLNGSIGSLAAKSPAEISQLQIRQPSALARLQESCGLLDFAARVFGMGAKVRYAGCGI